MPPLEAAVETRLVHVRMRVEVCFLVHSIDGQVRWLQKVFPHVSGGRGITDDILLAASLDPNILKATKKTASWWGGHLLRICHPL